jgi:hypothetical protein
MFGEGSIHYHVFKESFHELSGDCKKIDGTNSMGNQYHPEIMVFALTLLQDTDTKTYDSLCKVFFLPEIRHIPIAKLCLERVQFIIMYSKSSFMN